MLIAILAALAASADLVAVAPAVPPAIYTDPVQDRKSPAAMEVLHIPSGDVAINGVAYLAAGAGPNPTLVIFHGLPGNEKNLDLAQAVRRAGWNAVTFNYRGSWGSPGPFRFANVLADGPAVLTYLRANAAKLRINPARIAIAGHSMGGWAVAHTAAHDPSLAGAILISAANLGDLGLTHDRALADMADNLETLAATDPTQMVAELERDKAQLDWANAVPGLARAPLLILSSDDGGAPATDALARQVGAMTGARVKAVHVATDHGWSDRRIRLQSEIIAWLGELTRK
ncbi:MAG: alpha/beta fold hydrolase [Sphingomicrobium sp.]